MSSTNNRVFLGVVVSTVVVATYYRWRRKCRWDLSEKLSIILCTSPVRTNPSTLLIEETVGSVKYHAPASRKCRWYIVCDGYKIRQEPKFRSGQVTVEAGEKYEAFLEKLQRLKLGEYIRCPERLGFGFALKRALSFIKTPYVMVVQHDRNFVRDIDLEELVQEMEKNASWLFYLGLPTSTTLALGYIEYVLSKYSIRIKSRQITPKLHVLPLIQWYDSTHICLTKHYTQFVYRGDLVKKGGFVEDKLGQKQLADIRKTGLEAHAEYGTYVLDDGIHQPIVSHLDGHDPLSFKKFKFIKTNSWS
mmetsp:Transcript_1394/g.1814  ORF Transcript_1394/g.1814 Transcript_1394/m.1814 type:complete len:304 (-) Transcript_1394:190-1101(-)